MSAAAVRRHSSSSYYCRYTLDVLTDGSEFTGDGTLFLSVWKCPPPRPRLRRRQRTQHRKTNAARSGCSRGDGDHSSSSSDEDEDDASIIFGCDDDGSKNNNNGSSSSSSSLAAAAVLKARYAVSGLGDCTSRLAADQRFKLHPVRAVFVASSCCCDDTADTSCRTKNNNDDTTATTATAASSSPSSSSSSRGLWGLPSLMTALYQSGSPSVTIVTPSEPLQRVATEIVDLLESNRRNPTVQICHVPTSSATSAAAAATTMTTTDAGASSSTTKSSGTTATSTWSGAPWWKVYEDEYLLVHARQRRRGATNGCSAVMYLYTLLRQPKDPTYSILLLPPPQNAQPHGCLEIVEDHIISLRTAPLPLASNLKPCRIACAVALKLSPSSSRLTTASTRPATTISVNGNSVPLLYTRSSGIETEDFLRNRVDPRLLVRARRQSEAWHSADPAHFPWNCDIDDGGAPAVDEKDVVSSPEVRWLRTGTSLLLPTEASPFRMRDRTRGLITRDRSSSEDDGEAAKYGGKRQKSEIDSRSTWPSRYCFDVVPNHVVESSVSRVDAGDENEIELDDESSDEQDENYCHHRSAASSVDYARFLCLGTGCASPSPYRGASGYALFLNVSDSFVFEVGEGFVTQWKRYAGGRSLLSIRAIWISHAHWDHYGGIVPLLCAISDEKRLQVRLKSRGDSTLAKRQRTNYDNCAPPLVIASEKILKYLGICFDNRSADFFRARLLSRYVPLPRQVLQPCFASTIAFFQSIVVDHSCVDSFGFVLGIRSPDNAQPFIFCFSGDTRPCCRLVDACRFHARACEKGFVDFLLHEATFDENEAEMCMKKKHATIKEALMVAKDICAKRTFLTHFSQRYDSPPASKSENSGAVPTFDGLCVTLL